jgi:DNA polymerase
MNTEDPRSKAIRYLKQQRDFGVSEIIFTPVTGITAPGHDAETEKKSGRPRLVQLYESTKECLNCPLGHARTKYVFGAGNPDADLMFIGEAPGHDEDMQGIPFVGRAGQLLTKMIEAMGLKREQVFIANILKCRPPNNRDPNTEEVTACISILKKQIEIIRPRFICMLGRIAAQTLLATDSTLGKLRGTLHDWNGSKVLVTYHPSALLRNPNWKKPAWEDLQLLMQMMKISGKDV